MEPQTNSVPTQPAAPLPQTPSWPRVPRSLGAGRGISWWSEGWNVFMAAPWLWIGIFVVFLLMMIAMGFVPFLGNLAAALLGPVFFAGTLLGCHALAHGRPLEFEHLFAGFKDGRTGSLVILGLIAFAVSVALAFLIFAVVFGAMGLSGFTGMMSGDAGATMSSAMAGAGVAALLAIPIALIGYGLFLMAWFFAPALTALNRAAPTTALKASFDASWKNLGALALFSLIFIALAIVASIPFGLGWLVLGPVSIGAMYGAWREIFGE